MRVFKSPIQCFFDNLLEVHAQTLDHLLIAIQFKRLTRICPRRRVRSATTMRAAGRLPQRAQPPAPILRHLNSMGLRELFHSLEAS